MGKIKQTSGTGAHKRRRQRLRFNFGTVLFIWFITFLSCFALFMVSANLFGLESEKPRTSSEESAASDSVTTGGTELTTTTTTTTTTTAPTEKIINPVPASEARSATYLNDCVFIGDSITQGLSNYQVVPAKNVYASIGMNLSRIMTDTVTTTYGEVTAVEAVAQAKPERIYIMLGSNGIAWMKQDEMIADYVVLLEALIEASPASQIYILSVPPVSAERETASEGPITNAAVDSYNSALLSLANEYSIRYVDVNTALKGNDGKLSAEHASADGIHFNKAAYEIFIEYILTHTGE